MPRTVANAQKKNVSIEKNPRRAAAEFEAGRHFDIALIDITIPEMNGIELLEIIKNTSPATECIMVTAVDEARTAIQCLRKGAYDDGGIKKEITKVLKLNAELQQKHVKLEQEINSFKSIFEG